MKAMKMKLSSISVATSLALGAVALAPATVSAEVTSSATIASMYLWRGQNISDGAPALSGDIKYSHESGLYAYGWLSSEGVKDSADAATESYEVDFGIGYAGSVGDFGYDVQYYKFWYPESGETFGDAGAEYILSVSYAPVTFTAILDGKDGMDYKYYTVAGSMGAFTLKLGMWDIDTADSNYNHFDLTYAATDALSFTFSKRFGIDDGTGLTNDPLMMVSYSIPLK